MSAFRLVFRVLLVSTPLVLVSVSLVNAQSSVVCARALDAGEDQYVNAEYEEARRLVAACLNQPDIPREQAVSAYRMLALIHLKMDEIEEARSAIVNILGIDPDYEADPVNSPPAYASLVAIVQREVQGNAPTVAAASDSIRQSQRRPFFRRTSTWMTLGGIVAASGLATAIALGSGGGGGGGPSDQPGSLPLPPGTP